jgi:hypothetical protein
MWFQKTETGQGEARLLRVGRSTIRDCCQFDGYAPTAFLEQALVFHFRAPSSGVLIQPAVCQMQYG